MSETHKVRTTILEEYSMVIKYYFQVMHFQKMADRVFKSTITTAILGSDLAL